MGQQDIDTKDYQKHKVQFYKIFERLFASKGRKMDRTLLDGYWHALGNYQIDILSKAVDSLMLEDNAFLPDAGKIISEIKAIRGHDYRSQTTVPSWCDICNNTGMVLIQKLHNGTPYETVYACRCPNGTRVDQRIRPLPEDFVPPADRPLTKLPMVTIEILASMDADHVWDDGVDVAKLCSECRHPYVVRHERRVSVAELVETHLRQTRPHQCEPCFIEAGRRAGMWT